MIEILMGQLTVAANGTDSNSGQSPRKLLQDMSEEERAAELAAQPAPVKQKGKLSHQKNSNNPNTQYNSESSSTEMISGDTNDQVR